jgi:hypothetical protein
LEESEQAKRELVLQAQNETERVMRECRVIQEEKRMMTQKITEIQTESEDLKRRAFGKNDD